MFGSSEIHEKYPSVSAVFISFLCVLTVGATWVFAQRLTLSSRALHELSLGWCVALVVVVVLQAIWSFIVALGHAQQPLPLILHLAFPGTLIAFATLAALSQSTGHWLSSSLLGSLESWAHSAQVGLGVSSLALCAAAFALATSAWAIALHMLWLHGPLGRSGLTALLVGALGVAAFAGVGSLWNADGAIPWQHLGLVYGVLVAVGGAAVAAGAGAVGLACNVREPLRILAWDGLFSVALLGVAALLTMGLAVVDGLGFLGASLVARQLGEPQLVVHNDLLVAASALSGPLMFFVLAIVGVVVMFLGLTARPVWRNWAGRRLGIFVLNAATVVLGGVGVGVARHRIDLGWAELSSVLFASPFHQSLPNLRFDWPLAGHKSGADIAALGQGGAAHADLVHVALDASTPVSSLWDALGKNAERIEIVGRQTAPKPNFFHDQGPVALRLVGAMPRVVALRLVRDTTKLVAPLLRLRVEQGQVAVEQPNTMVRRVPDDADGGVDTGRLLLTLHAALDAFPDTETLVIEADALAPVQDLISVVECASTLERAMPLAVRVLATSRAPSLVHRR